MKKIYFIIQLVIFSLFWAASQTINAAAMWTMTPVAAYPPAVTVYLNETAVIKYVVTNQSSKIRYLKMVPIKGITASGCSSGLGYRQRCILNLVVNGKALTRHVVGGPVLCDYRGFAQCYRPSLRNILKIKLIKSLKTYKVTPYVGGKGAISPAKALAVKLGTKVVFTAKPTPGYGVGKWYLDKKVVQTGGTTYQLTNVKANHVLNVTFEQKFTVRISKGGNGSVSPSTNQTLTAGASAVFIATPDNGYAVDKWYVDNNIAQNGGTSFNLAGITANHAVKVTFAPILFTVTPSSGGNGLISPDQDQPVAQGANLNFVATPDNGYDVDEWYVDKNLAQTGGKSFDLMNITANHAVNVTFAPILFTVSPSSGGNGLISPDQNQPVIYGANLNFTATPDNGYDVDGWYVDNNLAQTGGTSFNLANITADQAVNVTFAPSLFTISPSSGGNGLISPDTDQSVTLGGNLSFTAMPGVGYFVKEWFVDNNLVQSGGASYQLNNITSNHSVSVTFDPVLYTVTPSAGANGLISPNQNQSLGFGANATFTATPNSGYGVKAWFVDGNQVQTGGASYQLTNVTADHTVNVTFDTATVSVLPVRAVLPVNGVAKTFTITNTGPIDLTNVSANLPAEWAGGVTQNASNCTTLARNASCTISLSATKPYVVSGNVAIVSEQIINPQPVIALAFSMTANNYLVFSVDTVNSKALVMNPIGNQYWGPKFAYSAFSLSDGKANENTVYGVNNWGASPCNGSPCGGIVACKNSTAGGASTGTWYLPAFCQMAPHGTTLNDSPDTPKPQCNSDNITDLVKYQFFTTYGNYHTSTEQLNAPLNANEMAQISSTAPYITLGLTFKNDSRPIICVRWVNY